MAVSSGGRRSPASIEIICPSFIAAPRKCDNRSATRAALAGVRIKSSSFGRSPFANRRAPSASIPPATPPASRPKVPRRDKRPVGTARPRFDCEEIGLSSMPNAKTVPRARSTQANAPVKPRAWIFAKLPRCRTKNNRREKLISVVELADQCGKQRRCLQ